MMNEFFINSAFAGVTISLVSYMLGMYLKKKFKLGIFNPLLIAIAVTMVILFALNVDYDTYNTGAKYLSWLLTPSTVCLAIPLYYEAVKEENAEILVVAAKIESEIAELETYDERQMFLQEIGLEESGVNRLIKSAYKLLNLQTFLTAGPDEVRAWTFHKGWKAPQCAGVIHTDFEKGFIRAEVIKYDDYISYGSEAAVKEAGKMSVEGKEYIVQDGDIMHFRFNV